jgi:hypothetical protein
MKQSFFHFRISTKTKRVLISLSMLAILFSLSSVTAYATAANSDVAGTMQTAFGTYMKPQIIKAVNGIIMPIIDAVIAIFFIIKIVMAGVNYRSNSGGNFEWHVPAILFAGLVISLTAPLWIWGIIGW